MTRPLSRLLKSSLSFGGGQGYTVAPFWQGESLRAPSVTFGSSLGAEERLESSFESYVHQGYKSNGIVFACIQARQLPFSEALFRRQAMDDGLPGALSYDRGLDVLERPWANGTTGELLSRMEQDASLAGNSYWTVVGSGSAARLRRLRPDWVTIISGVRGDREGSPFDIDAEVLAYIYAPKLKGGKKAPEPVMLTPDRVAHYSPVPDPEAQWRGMSWLTPVLREIDGDSAATRHKLKFFENGATSNFVVTYDSSIAPESFTQYVEMFEKAHAGVDKAYKTIHLGGGADARVVGADLKQLDFKATQGAGETRIAAAAGVGAIIAQFSEGMQGSSLNAGNYSSARRRFADMTLRPLWRMAAGSLEKFTNNPTGSRLWYADKHIDFLQEDAKDAAEIFAVQAQAYRTLVDGGAEPDSARAAIAAENIDLVKHTGKLSVQLTDPDATPAPEPVPEKQMTRDEFMAGMLQLKAAGNDAPSITVNTPPIHVDAPTQVTVDAGALADVLTKNAAPVINVSPTPITVDNTVNVDPTPITIDNTVNVDPTPVTVENHVETPLTKHRVKRDSSGNIIEVTEEPV